MNEVWILTYEERNGYYQVVGVYASEEAAEQEFQKMMDSWGKDLGPGEKYIVRKYQVVQ